LGAVWADILGQGQLDRLLNMAGVLVFMARATVVHIISMTSKQSTRAISMAMEKLRLSVAVVTSPIAKMSLQHSADDMQP
jgi:L-serine deaminase